MIGGDKYGGEAGFLGCMRNLYIQGIHVADISEASNVGHVVNGSCDLQDRFVLLFMCLFVAVVLVVAV